MNRKFLIVGLGGSGGKTLRFLRAELLAWLEGIGWTGGFPAGWQLLHIDSPTSQDGAEITEVPMLPAANYRGLVGSAITLPTIDSVLQSLAKDPDDLASWRVDPTHLKVPIAHGAGQYRAIGRAIGIAYGDVMLEAMRGAKSRLMAPEATAELNAIRELATGGPSADGAQDRPICIVVSSLAGGTGAGLLIDACDLLRQLDDGADTWADESFGFLYSADVFHQVATMQAGGMQPNTLAAVSEVVNGYLRTSDHPASNSILESHGAHKPISRSGPAYPFLVGATGASGASFGDQRDVYAMMGRALTSWVTDPVIQDELIAYVKTNWANSASKNKVSPDVPHWGHLPVFEAYGYAEVNLGTDRFEKYAMQRLAKQAALWLREGHLTIARSLNPNDPRLPQVIVDDMAQERVLSFLRAAELSERGTDDQIIDALVPLDADEMFLTSFQTLLNLVTAGESSLQAAQWLEKINQLVPGAAEDYDRQYDAAMRGRARVWSEIIPDKIVAALLDVIAESGLLVAARTIELTMDELESVVDELANEASEHLAMASDFRGEARAQLNVNGSIGADFPKLSEAVRHGLWALAGFTGDAKRRQVAMGLIRDLVAGYLRPLHNAVKGSAADLEIKGFSGEGGVPAPVPQWPDRAVPETLLPPRNEQVVIPIETFDEIYGWMLERSTLAEYDADREREARTEVISGSFLEGLSEKKRRALTPIQTNARWSPDPTLLIGSAAMKSTAALSTLFNPEDLLVRAREWMRRDGTISRRFLDSDLRAYLNDEADPDPNIRQQRRVAFKMAFESALKSAEPLVKIDHAMKAQLHPSAPSSKLVVSEIPLKEHPLEAETRNICHLVMGGDGGDAVKFTSTPGIRRIAISSTLDAPHDPMVFASLMGPIASGWAAAKGSPVSRNDFWKARRARPISEFVGMSQELLIAMTRGWMTGLVLGLIDRENLAIVTDSGTSRFPDPLLVDVDPSSQDVLPAVLESMMLAQAQAVQVGDLTPLKAYSALRDLGMAANAGGFGPEFLGQYVRPTPALADWIATGDRRGALTPGLLPEGLADSQARRDAAIQVFSDALSGYQMDGADFRIDAPRNPLRFCPQDGALRYGMMTLIEVALDQLIGALRRSATGGNQL